VSINNLKIFLKSSALLVMLIGLLFIISVQAKATVLLKDSIKVSLDSTAVFYNNNLTVIENRDSSLNEISRYLTMFKTGNFEVGGGTLFLPTRNLLFDATSINKPLFAKTNFESLFLDVVDDYYYHTYYPVTDVTAIVGGAKEQYVKLLHTQNVSPALNVGIQINGMRTAGYYAKQQSNYVSFKAFSSYFAKTGKYKMFFSFNYNKLFSDVNGGVKATSNGDYDYTTISDKALIPIYLTNAKHQIIQSEFYTKQVIGLDKKLLSRSIPYRSPDTVSSLNKIEIEGAYKEYYRFYTDGYNSDKYYRNYYLDTLTSFKNKLKVQESYGSVRFHNFVREMPFENKLSYSLLLGINNIDVTMMATSKQNYFTSYIEPRLAKKLANFIINGSIKYYLTGYNANDYANEISLTNIPNKKWQWKVSGNFSSMHSQGIFNNYFSNNFVWENHFESTQMVYVLGKIGHYRYGTINAGIYQIKNYNYFDSLAAPAQYKPSITLWQVRYNKILSWWHLRFSPEVLYQQENSTTQVLGLPKLYIKSGLYLEGRLFKKAMLYQIGTDIYWLQSYKPLAYMPASNVYYNQQNFNSTSRPVVDAFISFKIKSVRAFIRLEQLSAIGSPLYFYVPDHAIPGFAYKIGINWLFKK
jgi:hypothetical protein